MYACSKELKDCCTAFISMLTLTVDACCCCTSLKLKITEVSFQRLKKSTLVQYM